MKNWKIYRLRIESFKAFSRIELDFNAGALITLEGPNGYGKTSVFDALELLFTGSISRISELASDIADGRKKNYEDNLYWNKKSGESEVSLKFEFFNEDGESIVFARVATVADMNISSNNKADSFDIFKLYKIDDIDSLDFKDSLDSKHLETYFGRNFCHNYPMLNYFQQGQNPFLFAKSTSERKQALEILLNTSAIREKIDFCGKVEKKLSAKLSATEGQKTEELRQRVIELSGTDNLVGEEYGYMQISTKIPVPLWDRESPFATADSKLLANCLEDIQALVDLIVEKKEVAARIKNSAIDKFISEESDLLGLTVEIGKHHKKFQDLKTQSIRISSLKRALGVIALGPSEIKIDDIQLINEVHEFPHIELEELLNERNKLFTQISSNSLQIELLQQARNRLVEIHLKDHDDSSECPLCGFDWATAEQLKRSIDNTTEIFGNSSTEISTLLGTKLDSIQKILSAIKESIEIKRVEVETDYDNALFERLNNNSSKFDSLIRISNQLQEYGVDYDGNLSHDPLELAQRKEKLISDLRALKSSELSSLPVGWNVKLNETFNVIDDFFTLNKDVFEKKKIYLLKTYQDLRNSALQIAKTELASRIIREEGYKQAKKKISKLKSILTKSEKDYAARTIRQIELVFHIYSGRLIQNYQRGLGLFINEGDGKKIQFSTAEHSEHDAILSMSSGQLCALGMSFFLSLNRVYSKTPFILIDDPSQSLDEINVASLTDLLRSEFADRQLILSSHEDDIAAYMRYRFMRAGLTQKRFHMQTMAAQVII